MERNLVLIAAAFAAATLVSQDSLADRGHGGRGAHHRREHRQDNRIREGVKDGDLTRHEARKLRHEQRKLDRMETRAAADGAVTAKEAARIERARDRASAHIYKQKHDGQTRGATPAEPATPANPGTSPAEPAQPATPPSN